MFRIKFLIVMVLYCSFGFSKLLAKNEELSKDFFKQEKVPLVIKDLNEAAGQILYHLHPYDGDLNKLFAVLNKPTKKIKEGRKTTEDLLGLFDGQIFLMTSNEPQDESDVLSFEKEGYDIVSKSSKMKFYDIYHFPYSKLNNDGRVYFVRVPLECQSNNKLVKNWISLSKNKKHKKHNLFYNAKCLLVSRVQIENRTFLRALTKNNEIYTLFENQVINYYQDLNGYFKKDFSKIFLNFPIMIGNKSVILQDEVKRIFESHLKFELGQNREGNDVDISLEKLEVELSALKTELFRLVKFKYEKYFPFDEDLDQNILKQFLIIWEKILNPTIPQGKNKKIPFLTYLIRNIDVNDNENYNMKLMKVSFVEKVMFAIEQGVNRNGSIIQKIELNDIPFVALIDRLKPHYLDGKRLPYVLPIEIGDDGVFSFKNEILDKNIKSVVEEINIREYALSRFTKREIKYNKLFNLITSEYNFKEHNIVLDHFFKKNDITQTFNLKPDNIEKLSSKILTRFYEENDFESYNYLMSALEEAGCNFFSYGENNRIESRHIETVLKDMYLLKKKLTFKKNSNNFYNDNDIDITKIFFNNERILPLWHNESPWHHYNLKFIYEVFERRGSIVDNLINKFENGEQNLRKALEDYTNDLRFRDRFLLNFNSMLLKKNIVSDGGIENSCLFLNILRYFENNDDFYSELKPNEGLSIALTKKNGYELSPIQFYAREFDGNALQYILNSMEKLGVNVGLDEVDGFKNTLFHIVFYPKISGENPRDSIKKDDEIKIDHIKNQDEVLKSIAGLLELGTSTPARIQETVKALNSKNYLDFTPLTLAVLTENFEGFAIMREFLRSHSKWDEFIHSRNGNNLHHLLSIYLSRFEDTVRPYGLKISNKKLKVIKQLKNEVEERLKLEKEYGLGYPGRDDRKVSKMVLKKIEKETKKIFKEYLEEKESLERGSIYTKMMNNAMKYLRPDPTQKISKVKNIAGLLGATNVNINININININMAYTGPSMQFEWVIFVITPILENYLSFHRNSPKETWENIYKDLTGNSNFDYFSKIFNSPGMEFEIQEYMKKYLKGLIIADWKVKKSKDDQLFDIFDKN